MRTLKKHAAFAVISFAPAVFGQSVGVGGPASTYMFDAAKSGIRPLIGLAGSSFLGAPVLSGVPFASVAPNGLTAVVFWPERTEWVANLGDYENTASIVGGALLTADRVFWDQDSRLAVLFSSREKQVQFLAHSTNGFVLENSAAPDSCTGSVMALAAEAAKSMAILSCGPSEDDPESPVSLNLVQPGSGPIAIAAGVNPAAAAFGQSGELYVGGTDGSVSVVRDLSSGSPGEVLFSDPDAPSGYSALVVAGQENLLFLADAVQHRVRVYDLSTLQKVDDLDVYFQPTQFQPFLANSFLLNTGENSSESRILLRTAPRREILFVPAGD